MKIRLITLTLALVTLFSAVTANANSIIEQELANLRRFGIIRVEAAMSEPVYAEGDVNGDGKVDIDDVLAVRNYVMGIVGLDEPAFLRADLTRDAALDIDDILLLRALIMGIAEPVIVISEPSTPEPTPEPTPAPPQKALVNSSNGLHLRTGPGTGYSSIAVMPKGAEVTLLDPPAEWSHVQYRTNTGYAFSQYLTLQTPAPDPTPGTGPSSPISSGALPQCPRVGNDYFANTLFLGDSNTVGLFQSTGLPARCSGRNSAGVFSLDQYTYPVSGQSGTYSFDEMLQKQSYCTKIYINFGTNDVGYYSDTARFETAYKNMLARVRAVFPTQSIILQGVLPISAKKESASGGAFSKQKINAFNDFLLNYANSTPGVYFVSSHLPFADADGYIASGYTSDGVHANAAGYAVWAEYLYTHALV